MAGGVYDEPGGLDVEEPGLLTFALPAVGDSVPDARRRLVAFAREHGAADTTVANVALCVSEAVTNAIVHGCRRDPSCAIEIVADALDGAIEIVVLDDGPGLAARVESDGLGLGLGVIAQASARFAIRDRAPHGTELWMCFELP
ncbi:MAG TPA: ATP-binding protein [Solirubrobacteraceae bacterium]|nr:ATP-binding protein [Solirubrobacteraceae bacterium]